MVNRMQFYIDGAWVDPAVKKSTPVVNPATEEAMYEIALGSKADVDKAVAAAKRAFETFSQTSREERVALLTKIIEIYKGRMKEIGAAVSDEMGAPLPMAEKLQAGAGLGHIAATLDVLKNYHFEETVGSAVVVREPVGVIGMITPWNWPLNQIACKVAPALAAGCTMILKPSEFTPTSALIFAEILHEAGVPKGVFNLVNGLGPEVGAAMSEHPDIDMISFTGSTRAGIDVAKRAAPTVKRVSQELGGKSPNVILEGADLTKAVTGGVMHMFNNSGQSCNAPSRMIVPLSKMKEVAAIAKGVADKTKAGDPRAEGTTIGPVVNRGQWDKIQGLIQKGIEEGATLVAGGPGLPEGVNKGFYVRPTIFADVTEDMTIAREEIFGPVLVIMGAKDEEDAVQIANDTPYGLAGYVSADTVETARKVGRRIRAGNVNLQGVPNDRTAPFGGYKQSGNGREWGNSASRNSSRSRRSPASTPRKRPQNNNTAPERIFCSGVLAFWLGAQQTQGRPCGSLLSPRRALGVHVQRIDRLARGHEQPVALHAAEADIGAALGQRDAADRRAVGRIDHHAVEFGIAHAPAAPQIAVDVAAHAVRRAGTGVDQHPLVGDFIAARPPRHRRGSCGSARRAIPRHRGSSRPARSKARWGQERPRRRCWLFRSSPSIR